MTPNTALKIIYRLTVAAILFTGFGNMPLWKRYYIADIPGLAWAGDFYRNVIVHYGLGIFLFAVAAYVLVTYFHAFMQDPRYRSTRSAKVRAALLAGALMTGLVMAIKNLPGITIPLPLLVSLNLAHMMFAMLFMFVSLACLFMRIPWLQKTEADA